MELSANQMISSQMKQRYADYGDGVSAVCAYTRGPFRMCLVSCQKTASSALHVQSHIVTVCGMHDPYGDQAWTQ